MNEEQRHCKIRQNLLTWYADAAGNSSNAERVRQHYIFLVDHLDIKYSGLLYQLYADGVLDVHDMEDINSQQTNMRQNEKLLCLLSRKSVEQFQIFLQHLDNSGQRHIRDVFEHRQGFLYAYISFYTILPVRLYLVMVLVYAVMIYWSNVCRRPTCCTCDTVSANWLQLLVSATYDATCNYDSISIRQPFVCISDVINAKVT